MAVIGEDPDGRLAILDPSYYAGKYEEEEGRGGKVALTQGVITLCPGEVLAKECERKAVPYYLFWRP